MTAVDTVSVTAVLGIGAAFVIGIVVGVVLTLLASKSSHPVTFDWRLLIRRTDVDESDVDED